LNRSLATAIAAGTALLHLACGGRYGYYRDELYFIACAKRLAWGYVDMPPLAPFFAWLSTPAHYNLIALRAGVAIAAGLTVYVACAMAAEFGGGVWAQCVAGLAVALMPAYLFLGTTLTTTSFEPLTWSLAIYCVMRLVRSRNPRWWFGITAAATAGLYGKYSILLLFLGLSLGLLATPQRAVLRTRGFLVSVLATFVLLLPNVLWQAAHGWPIADVLRGDIAGRHAFNSGMQFEFRQPLINAGVFFLEQILFANPIVAPVWVAGAAALFGTRLRVYRFLGIAFCIVLIAAAALNAKGYYIAGIYAALMCAGCVFLERSWEARPALRLTAAGAMLASGLVLAPFTIPLLSATQLIAYSKSAGLTGRDGNQPHLIQPLFADEFGWRNLAARVAQFYHALPARQRARTAIYSDTYAGAAAIEFYGAEYGLPQPISAQNEYYLWGTRDYDGRSVLAIGASQAALLPRLFKRVVLLGTFEDPLRWAAEGPTPIYLCTLPAAPLDALWPRLRWYGA
jgi:hypothetical protein